MTDSTIYYNTPLIPYLPVDTNPADSACALFCLDSILAPIDTTPPILRQSMFTHHTLKAADNTLHPRTDTSQPAWLFIGIMILIVAETYYYKRHKITFSELIGCITDRRTRNRTLYKKNMSRRAALLPIAIFISAILTIAILTYAMPDATVLTYLIALPLVFLAYMLRNGTIRLLGTVFDHEEATSAYIVNTYLYHLLLATITTPLLLFEAFTPGCSLAFIIAIATITAIEFIARFVVNINEFLTQIKTLDFLLFYYLCIVESVPILVLVKWIIVQ